MTGATLAAALFVTNLLAVPRARVTAARPHGRRRTPGNTAALLCTLDHFALGAGVLDRDGR